jgi:hypothetical protein
MRAAPSKQWSGTYGSTRTLSNSQKAVPTLDSVALPPALNSCQPCCVSFQKLMVQLLLPRVLQGGPA